mgnify:CR=1 FL=1
MAVLSKLLKYDLRANLKIFLFIWPAILVFGLLERVALMAELPVKISAIFVNLTTVLFVLAVIAACVFALVISVIRFYSGLLRDEGYLMFTLPVRPWQLVLSKLLTALLTLVVTGLVSFVSVGILFGRSMGQQLPLTDARRSRRHCRIHSGPLRRQPSQYAPRTEQRCDRQPNLCGGSFRRLHARYAQPRDRRLHCRHFSDG